MSNDTEHLMGLLAVIIAQNTSILMAHMEHAQAEEVRDNLKVSIELSAQAGDHIKCSVSLLMFVSPLLIKLSHQYYYRERIVLYLHG